MTPTVKARTARRLGSGRRLVEVELPPGAAPPAVEDVRVTSHHRGAAGEIRVELLVPPAPGQGRRWGIVVAWEEAPAFDLSPDELEIRVRGVTVLQPRAGSDLAEPFGSQGDAIGRGRHVDYRARDFDAVRTAMLRRIVDAVGPSVDLNPVGETTAVVEVLAYLADNLSYAQDAIATEAYLSTARRRISVARHAALMDYWVHPGSNARTWVRLDVEGNDAVELPKGTPLLTGVQELPTHMRVTADLERAVAHGALVFETMADVLLRPHAPPFEIDRTAHPEGVLPPNATAATCIGHTGLEEGTLAVVETLSEPMESHVVRLTRVVRVRGERDVSIVEWGHADALPDHSAWRRPVRLRVCNLVLADHGRTQPRSDGDPAWEALPKPVAGHPYWPALPHRDISFSRPLPPGLRAVGATEALAADAEPLGDVTLEERAPSGTYRWRVRRSLLDSGPGARDVVVEADNDGTARLRFGDGVNGMRPHADSSMYVRMRVGGGTAGNVRPGAIAHVVAPGLDATVTNVSNVVQARGGSSPERLSSVRTYAPRAFRINRRVVTKDDYENATRRVRGVLDVDVELTSSGAGALVVVRVHSGWPSSKTVLSAVETALAPRRVLGVALEVLPSMPRPVEIDIDVWLDEGWEASVVQPALDRTIRSQLSAPGRFGFHTSLHRSDVLVPVAAVPGVADVRVTRFRIAGAERDQDELRPGRGQILEIGDPAGAPAMGVVSYRLRGGAR